MLQRLTQWLGRGRGAPQRETLTAMTLDRDVRDMLARQRADAAEKDAESWRWGNTGAMVRRAARDCEAIVLPVTMEQPLAAYFERVLDQLAALAERYRHDAGDAEGYGLGTVREVEEAMKVKARVAGLKI